MRAWILVVLTGVLLYYELIFAQDWQFQESIRLPQPLSEEVGNTYGLSPSILQGRGIMTLVTGYSSNRSGIFVQSNSGYPSGGDWALETIINQEGLEANDLFGKQIVNSSTSIIVSAPSEGSGRYKDVGAVYVFNLTTSKTWVLLQKLRPIQPIGNEKFGDSVRISGNTMIVSAAGTTVSSSVFAGAVYVYTKTTGSLLWVFQSMLIANDAFMNQYFGQTIDIDDNIIVIGARNDVDQGSHSGSVYVYTKSTTTQVFTFQQKIVGTDILLFQPDRDLAKSGTKFFGSDIAVGSNFIVVGIVRTDKPQQNQKSIYVYKVDEITGDWVRNQTLFSIDDDPLITRNDLNLYYHDLKLRIFDNNLYVTVFLSYNSFTSICYEFETINGNAWQLKQRITYPGVNFNALLSSNNSSTSQLSNFSSPMKFGSYLLFQGNNEVLLFSKINNRSCLILSMSDHFGDGWDTAVLTVRAPDQSNNSFQPLCSSPDPYTLRYCPDYVSDQGQYVIKVFAPTHARFFWEISWAITIESSNQTYFGDFSTKVIVFFDTTKTSFSYYSSENLVIRNDSKCFPCAAVTSASWITLQTIGRTTFFPIDVTGADYFISTFSAFSVVFTGRACPTPTKSIASTYECYQTLYEGIYILRLGKGNQYHEISSTDVNSGLGIPLLNSQWKGCGQEGGLRDQLIFRIVNDQCIPIQKFTYSSRCSHPTGYDLNIGAVDVTQSPTSSGTRSPTSDVFGSVTVQTEITALSVEKNHWIDILGKNINKTVMQIN